LFIFVDKNIYCDIFPLHKQETSTQTEVERNTMAQDWFYRRAGSEFGAMAAADLKRLAASGQLGPQDEVRKAGMATWVQARFVKGLFPEAPADMTDRLIQAAEVLLRTKDYKRAEASFSQVLDIEPKYVQAWVGKAKAIGFQTWAAAPTGLVIQHAFEDRSELAILCLEEARRICVTEDESLLVEKSKSEIIQFTIKVLCDAARDIYHAMKANRESGLLFTRIGPAAGIQNNFVGGKAVPMLQRCRELDPENQTVLTLLAEALEFCGDTKSALDTRAALSPKGNGVLEIKWKHPPTIYFSTRVLVDGQEKVVPHFFKDVIELLLPSGGHEVQVTHKHRLIGLKVSASANILVEDKLVTRWQILGHHGFPPKIFLVPT